MPSTRLPLGMSVSQPDRIETEELEASPPEFPRDAAS
jgi:hypothetical protein